MAQGGKLQFVAFRLPLMILAFLLLALPAWAGPEHQDDLARQYARAKTYYDELAARDTGKDRNSWLTAATAFRSIYKAAPEHAVAPKSLYMLGKIFQAMFKQSGKEKDTTQAIAAYEELSTKYPGNTLADDAFFILGNIYLADIKDPAKAARAYAKIIAIYPEGDMAGAAEKQLLLLKAGTAPPAFAEEGNGEKCLSPLVPDEPSPKNLSAKNSGPATVLPIRHWSNKHYTRLIIETTAPVTFKHQTLMGEKDSQRRIYFDLHNSRLSPNTLKTIPIEDGLLRRVRNAQFDPETVRVVLDTQTNISDYKIFTLDEPFRVVIDVLSNAGAPLLVLKPGLTKKMAARETNKTEAPLDQRPLLNLKKIVIDPGHGGKDPGTCSPNGLKEKDIVLDVALRVAKVLRENPAYEVILTRDRDVFIPLEERTALANAKEADLFLSIHVNAAPNHEARGIETYVLAQTSDKESMRLAAMENSTSAKQTSDLQSILLDLMQNSKLNESLKLAGLVQEEMVDGLKKKFNTVADLGVKKAPFVVLIGAQMPAALTEIAFMSNPEEEKRLADEAYLTGVATHLAGGVSQYLDTMSLASNHKR
jgi:N-acetylmuramoyl-L-alanine amidase